MRGFGRHEPFHWRNRILSYNRKPRPKHPSTDIHRFKTVLSRITLTDKAILNLPFTTAGQRLVRDAELSGFFVMVGKRTKTFMVQRRAPSSLAEAR